MPETNKSWIAWKDALLADPMQKLWRTEEGRMQSHLKNGTKPETGLYWFYFFFIRHRFVPNAITIIRTILTPVLYYHLTEGNNETAFYVFTTAALLDFIDGILARGFFNITKFGKIADPIADKLLTVAVLLGFANDIPDSLFWSILGIAVFLALISLTLLLLKKLNVPLKRDFGASSWGKWKFATECVGYALLFLDRLFSLNFFWGTALVLLWLSVLLGIASILGYLWPSVLARLDSYKT